MKTNAAGLRDPEIDLAKVPQMRPALERAGFFENNPAEAYYRKMGFKPKYVDTLPKKVRTWENGFLDRLTDGGVKLSRYGIEAVRESGALWAYYEPTSDLYKIREEGLAQPTRERQTAWLADRLYAVADRSLTETCGFKDPSPELRQYNYANFVAHWVKRVKRWGYADIAKGDGIKKQHRYFEGSDYLKDPGVECEASSTVYKSIVNAGVGQHRELNGLEALCATGIWENPGEKGFFHALNFVEIAGSQMLFNLTPFNIEATNDIRTWWRARRVDQMGALDELSWSVLSVEFLPYYEGSYEKVKGQINLGPWNPWRIGQDRQGRLDLGNVQRELLMRKDQTREAENYQKSADPEMVRFKSSLSRFLGYK